MIGNTNKENSVQFEIVYCCFNGFHTCNLILRLVYSSQLMDHRTFHSLDLNCRSGGTFPS